MRWEERGGGGGMKQMTQDEIPCVCVNRVWIGREGWWEGGEEWREKREGDRTVVVLKSWKSAKKDSLIISEYSIILNQLSLSSNPTWRLRERRSAFLHLRNCLKSFADTLLKLSQANWPFYWGVFSLGWEGSFFLPRNPWVFQHLIHNFSTMNSLNHIGGISAASGWNSSFLNFFVLFTVFCFSVLESSVTSLEYGNSMCDDAINGGWRNSSISTDFIIVLHWPFRWICKLRLPFLVVELDCDGLCWVDLSSIYHYSRMNTTTRMKWTSHRILVCGFASPQLCWPCRRAGHDRSVGHQQQEQRMLGRSPKNGNREGSEVCSYLWNLW